MVPLCGLPAKPDTQGKPSTLYVKRQGGVFLGGLSRMTGLNSEQVEQVEHCSTFVPV